MLAGLSLQAIGMGWVALIAEPDAFGELVVPMIVAGIGASTGIPAALSAVVGSVGAEAIGKAAGANGRLRELGGVFGIAIIVAVFAETGGHASAQAFSDGFVPAIAVTAALALSGALTGLGSPAGAKRPRSSRGARSAQHPTPRTVDTGWPRRSTPGPAAKGTENEWA